MPILNTLPVRAKVINNRCAHTFALTGRRSLYADTQGVALGYELAALSGRSRRGLRGIAPERGAYSRIGACPYLPPVLINSRCCPCKGRISWAGLAPQHLSRYEPLTGRVFKIASKSYAFFAYSIDAFDYQVRRKVFNRPFLNMAVSSILQPFFEVEVNSSVLVG